MNIRKISSGESENQLPTLQMNALRKLLSRPEFTPEEVAALGYRKLKKAEGIGNKGLENIVQWLHRFGLEVAGDPPATAKPARARRLEQALTLLQANGYTVQPRPVSHDPDSPACSE